MNTPARLALRLTIPVYLRRFKPTYLGVEVPLRIGPFPSSVDASIWEQQFLQAATISWQARAQKNTPSQSEGRTATGRRVRQLFDKEQVEVSSAISGGSLTNPDIHITIGEGVEDHVTRPHTARSRDDLFDIDPAMTPFEVARDLKDYVLGVARTVIMDF